LTLFSALRDEGREGAVASKESELMLLALLSSPSSSLSLSFLWPVSLLLLLLLLLLDIWEVEGDREFSAERVEAVNVDGGETGAM